MKRFFEIADGELSDVQDIQSVADEDAVSTITPELASHLRFTFDVTPSLPIFAKSGFRFKGDTFYEIDAKGKVRKLDDVPEWDIDTSLLTRLKLLRQYELLGEPVELAIDKLSHLTTHEQKRIWGELLGFGFTANPPVYQGASSGSRGGKSTASLVELPTGDSVPLVINNLKECINSQEVPDNDNMMIGFARNDAETKRQMKTIYAGITGEMFPTNTRRDAIRRAPERYFGMLSEKVAEVERVGVDIFTEELTEAVIRHKSNDADGGKISTFRM